MTDYRIYIRSDQWKARKRTFIRRAGYACSVCGAKNTTLHVHHLTYENLGNEYEEDVAVLCEKCHNEVHEIVDEVIIGGNSFNPQYERLDNIAWRFCEYTEAPHKLLTAIVATFAGCPIDRVSRSTFFHDLADFMKRLDVEIVKCQSNSEALFFLDQLTVHKIYGVNDVKTKVSQSQSETVYLYYSPGPALIDEEWVEDLPTIGVLHSGIRRYLRTIAPTRFLDNHNMT